MKPGAFYSYTAELAKECLERAYALERSGVLGDHGEHIIDNLRRAGLALEKRNDGPNEPVVEACSILRQVFNDCRLVDLQFDNLDRRMQTFLDSHDATNEGLK